jgi:hypothetical protein
MIRIDDTLLEEIGLLSLPKAERDQMLRQIYETLEMRVGMKLAERMTDQQLDEFERFIDTNDEAGALKWLESNFPDYKQVVADELEKLKVEIKKDSGALIEAVHAQGAQTPMQQSQPMPTQQPMQPQSQPLNMQQPQQYAQPYQQPQPVFSQPQPAQAQSAVQQDNGFGQSQAQSQPGPAQFQQPVQPLSQPQQPVQDDATDVQSQQTGGVPPPPIF